MGASLVAQWLRIHLPMQGTWVRALVQEDTTCCGATKPVRHNYWACAPQPMSHNYWARMPQLLSLHAATTEAHTPRACAPQQEKPLQWEARAPQRRVANAAKNKTKQNKTQSELFPSSSEQVLLTAWDIHGFRPFSLHTLKTQIFLVSFFYEKEKRSHTVLQLASFFT